MVLAWILWTLGVGLWLGLGIVAKEWIWRPLLLIQHCKRQGIKGFPFVPFVGQLPAIDEVLKGRNRREPSSNEDTLTTVQNCYRKHGGAFYFTVGKTVRLSIADPQLIKDILIVNSDSYIKPLHVRILGILGDGLFASSGNSWAPQRQLFNGPFHNKEVKSKIPTMIACAHAATERWVIELSGGHGELDMYQKFAELTLDVIGVSAFGSEIGGASKCASSVIGSFNRYLFNCRELVFGLAAAWPGYLYVARRIKNEIAEDRRWIASFMDQIIGDRAPSNHGIGGIAETVPHSRDLLDVMIGAANRGNVADDAILEQNRDLTPAEKRKVATESIRLTHQQLLDNSITFLLAGHETTASLLTWTIYLLAKHPLWQERARAEVEEFCPDGVVENPQVLNHLKLLGMILFESLRLFPPVPLIGRTCIEQNKIGPSLIIPQGLEIVIPVAMIHRDQSIWGRNADDFWPARFANGISGACGNPLAFLPFGAGPRTCIGQTLALSEAKAVLAVMLPMFTWKLSPSYRHSPDVTLTMMPEYGMPIVLEMLQH